MYQGTTVVAVKRNGKVAIAGDGQVTYGNHTIMKHKANKIRRLYEGKILAGFAGSVADAFTLFEKFEAQLQQHRGNLLRAAVELAKEWRSDKILRRLEASLVISDKNKLLLLSGSGEVIEPDDGIIAVGSGGSYAMAAARALYLHTPLSAVEIAREALLIAASICVFTNNEISIEELPV